jgi:hypothetical protein
MMSDLTQDELDGLMPIDEYVDCMRGDMDDLCIAEYKDALGYITKQCAEIERLKAQLVALNAPKEGALRDRTIEDMNPVDPVWCERTVEDYQPISEDSVCALANAAIAAVCPWKRCESIDTAPELNRDIMVEITMGDHKELTLGWFTTDEEACWISSNQGCLIDFNGEDKNGELPEYPFWWIYLDEIPMPEAT